MKKILIVLFIFLAILGCKKYNPGPTTVIPSCSWNSTEQIVFYNLKLNYPGGLSDYHSRLLPFEKFDKSLIDVLVRNGDVGGETNKANIRANVKTDGTKCIGERTTTYDGTNYTSGLGGNMIKSPFPSNAPFVGEITVVLKSATYHNTSGSGAFYHILWEQTGNSPNGGMDGTMFGRKMSYNTYNGSKLIAPEPENKYIYSGGKKMPL